MSNLLIKPPITVHRRRGDRLPDYVLDVLDDRGAPVDLMVPSTPVVRFTMVGADGSIKINRAAGLLQPGADAVTTNRLRYMFALADVDEQGRFLAEFELDYGASGNRTFPADPVQRLVINIHTDLDNT